MMPMSEVSNPEIKDTIEKIQKQLDELKKQHGMFKENPSGNFESSKNESELGDWAKEESDYNVKLEDPEPQLPKGGVVFKEAADNELGDWAIEKEEIKASENNEVKIPSQNKLDGLARETEVEIELEEKYPEAEGYTIESEVYLRDKDGNIVKDPETGEARRIDFVVIKDGKVVDSIEVTSQTADKTEQTAKENRIRENGGNYIKDKDGNLIEIPADVQTRIERRD